MGQIIALDSMIFIYLFEEDKRFFTHVRELFKRIESGEVGAVTSIISLAETLSPSKYVDRIDLMNEIEGFFRESSGLTVLHVDWEIGQKAAQLRRENRDRNLRIPDAIQLATAIVGGASVFVTNDVKLKGLKLGRLKIKILGVLQ